MPFVIDQIGLTLYNSTWPGRLVVNCLEDTHFDTVRTRENNSQTAIDMQNMVLLDLNLLLLVDLGNLVWHKIPIYKTGTVYILLWFSKFMNTSVISQLLHLSNCLPMKSSNEKKYSNQQLQVYFTLQLHI
jgi:hypothetical protein